VPAKPPYRLLESRKLYRGFNFQLTKDRFVLDAAPGKVVTRELVDHPGAVVILPFAGKKRILLLRQFRYAARGDLWEIPAGTLERGEKTLACAKRELEEETGFRAKRWKLLARFFPAPGISNELMTLYKAEGLEPGKKNLDHDEWIEHETVSLAKARRMIRQGTIRDAKTIIAVLWASFFDGR
jgi:ADP-ribose pyrophosphatase